MSKQEWTKEPWAYDGFSLITLIGRDEDGRRTKDFIAQTLRCGVTISQEDAKANGRRIVDCVNACTGIDSPAEYISSLRQENERLRSALGRLVEVAKAYGIFMAGVTPLNVLRSEDMQSEHKSFADGIQSARQALTKEG